MIHGMEAEGIDWTSSTRTIVTIFVAALVLTMIPRQPIYFGFVPWLNAMCGILFAFYFAARWAASQAASAVRAYCPTSSVAAKRANEQIKLTANTVNAVALATAAAFGIAEFAKNDEPNYFVMIAYSGFAFDFHRHARDFLSLLKDENVGTTPD